MANAHHVRIFPHDSEDEFPSMELLMMWLLNCLRGRGGEYHLRDATKVKYLPRGSVVLFRWGKEKIVGEGVVSKEKEVFPKKVKERTLLGNTIGEYAARITFAPSSIRLYSPALATEYIQGLLGDSKDIMTYPGGYIELDWALYSRILSEVVLQGGFAF